MAMPRATSGPAYPKRFYAAASYVGLDGSDSSAKNVSSKFSDDTALLLYALYHQATVGPCNTPKPSAWRPVEQSKWRSWQGLGTMPSIEAMRLFVKILEEDDPGWYSRASNDIPDPVVDVQINRTKDEPVVENGNSFGETKTISTENGRLAETQDKDVVSEDSNTVSVYNQWTAPQTSGQRPKARYEHGAAVIQDKMYIYGGNHNGRYLGDLHVLDLKNWTWSRVETKVATDAQETSTPTLLAPCAGHSLIAWDNKLLSIGGHTKDPSESMQVKVFDPHTSTWSMLQTYGKPPVSRGGQSVTLVGKTLVIFGGQDAKRSLLNDLHILDLDTMTWDEIDAVGVSPSPRSDHAAAVHAERYLLIFGGGSHATCFDDLHVLDLQTMEWSRPAQQGDAPTPRAGHAGVTIGENWFIVGGGDNKSGASESVVLNMSTLSWSVVASVQGRVPLASEGLSLVVSSYNGEDVLVAFGGYNGRYNNEINLLKPSHKSTLQTKTLEAPLPGSLSAVNNATTRDIESEVEVSQEGRVREIVMDNVNPGSKVEGNSERIIATIKSEKEELEASLNKERMQTLQLRQELGEAELRNTDLYKELQSVRGQLAAEQSRCFKLEVDVAELRQKLQTLETLQKELELLQRQKAASEQAAMNAKRQSSGGVWGWLAGSPQEKDDDSP
ncbi:acyl-CoA-binding domain-containing protein 4 isoform X2 [Arabidopsis lyrata subsp. lyrata]|uniref:acyl-CoA-binding domain-containing protein 4 isoform X2 n=1 Tax=Arabidopsis lyrata subsp. lyrata TaxID=81972 RepID=UPI000A29A294|nr:acyl-CoA-binding domain-containing protein 4 isoform X2 [Arabidopsis lyrata subsp. lyrata]|eukprot:XP_020887907.1 acyl-CoA-binding domain-containing protein 4 isoform X2 [Arabidopsis lyrata subsp. lyrata]